MQNKVQLITYVERFAGAGIRELHELLRGPLAGVFGGMHLLPFFHRIDGADAGFDPIDHTRVDERLGDWDDIRALANSIELMADVIVNHVSSESPQFQDYSAHGSASRYAGLFLTRESVFPQGVTPADLARIYRPRPGAPFTEKTLQCGERPVLWTTFTPQQIDINVFHPEGARYLDGILRRFADSGIRAIRLDAAGYAVKKAGTSCFMLPETHAFIDDFTRRAHALGIEVLVEIHAHYSRQIEIARHVDWVYDFALPPLLLHAFVHGVAEPLQRWVAMRPTNSLTVLDTHDGIGIIDIGADAHEKAARPGLVPPEELERLVEAIHANSNGQSRRATGAAASNLDLYQVNCTYYDALARDDLRYLLARAVQLFLPGIPQIYYMGLLAEPNDMALLEQTGVGRDINRHRFSRDEVLQALQRPVVADLLGLVRLRNTLPAFGGTFRCAMPAPSVLELSWFRSQSCASLRVDFASLDYRIVHTGADGREKELRFESVAGARQPFSTIDCKTVANDCNGS